jgi:ribonuclease HI
MKGACYGNDQHEAHSGIGIAPGKRTSRVPVDKSLDSGARTSQRTELLAAIEGLKQLEEDTQAYERRNGSKKIYETSH